MGTFDDVIMERYESYFNHLTSQEAARASGKDFHHPSDAGSPQSASPSLAPVSEIGKEGGDSQDPPAGGISQDDHQKQSQSHTFTEISRAADADAGSGGAGVGGDGDGDGGGGGGDGATEEDETGKEQSNVTATLPQLPTEAMTERREILPELRVHGTPEPFTTTEIPDGSNASAPSPPAAVNNFFPEENAIEPYADVTV